MALPVLLDAIGNLPAFHKLSEKVPLPGEHVSVSGLPGSAQVLLAAAVARLHPGRFMVVVCDTVSDAERWLADLASLSGEQGIALYPPREGFGEIEPHAEVAGERIETLERIGRGEARLLLTTPRALLEQTRMPRAVQESRLELRRGQVMRPQDITAHLESVGFERVAMVDDVAQFSLRGGILDVYGFGMAEPVRMEFWGDEIAELKHFDLVTQRSTRNAEVALILPVDGGVRSTGAEFERVTLSELFPPDTLLMMPAAVHMEPELLRTWEDAQSHLEVARRRGEDVSRRDELFASPEVIAARLRAFGTVRVVAPDEAPDVTFPLVPPDAIDRDIRKLRQVVRDGLPTMILCDNRGQAERLDELLNEDSVVPSPAALVVGVLGGGFVLPPAEHRKGLRVLTDHEIFRRERRIRRARRYAATASLETITGLKAGDYVVHLEHGVGIYRGIERIFVRESTVEVAVLEYEGGDRLNVPLYRVDQIERYRAAESDSADSPPPRLHKLGGKRWTKQRDRTRAAVLEMTSELLELYARRETASRPPHVPDTAWQRQLESSFLFEDTPDQRRATVEVKADMERARPMDRLLVGDVGYGKTEIAVRAAFKAVQSGRQVAVLVPTTILADQHARTFGDRLADFPVRIEALSRFQSSKEQAAVLKALSDGKVDILIGTDRKSVV